MDKNEGTEQEAYGGNDPLGERLGGSAGFFNRYSKVILGVLIAIVVIVGGYLFYNYQKEQQNIQAQEEMYHAVYFFEADSLDKALRGDVTSKGFLDIADDYEGTEAANLANYYIGVIYIQKGEFQSAIEHLQEFSADDLLVQARAYNLIGDAYMELENYSDAAEYYERAADYKPNEYFTPAYLMDLALAYEMQGNYEEAVEAYDRIINEYPSFTNINDAKKFRANALAKVRE